MPNRYTPPKTDEERALARSYRTWLRTEEDWQRIKKHLPTPTDDVDLQWYYEQLSDEQRQAWDRWVPGGNATEAEWAAIRRMFP